jgi:hypothetical protein
MYMRSEQRGVGRNFSAHASLFIGSSDVDLDLAVDLNATQTEGAIHRRSLMLSMMCRSSVQVHDDVQVHRS